MVMLAIFGEQVFHLGGQGGGSGILYSMRGIGAAIGPILAWRLLGESDREMYRSIGLGPGLFCDLPLLSGLQSSPDFGLGSSVRYAGSLRRFGSVGFQHYSAAKGGGRTATGAGFSPLKWPC